LSHSKKSHHKHKYYNHSFLIFFLFSFPQHGSSQSKNHITITNFRIIHLTITNLKKSEKKFRGRAALGPVRRREGRPSPRALPEAGRAPARCRRAACPARRWRAGLAPRGRRAWPRPMRVDGERGREGEREDESTRKKKEIRRYVAYWGRCWWIFNMDGGGGGEILYRPLSPAVLNIVF